MEYQLRIKPSAEKELNKLSRKDYYRVLAALGVIIGNPFLGKKLEGVRKGEWSYRVWPYRVIYKIFKKELLILVIDIGRCRGVY